MVFCTRTSQYCLRAVVRANIRIQLSALRVAADTERSPHSYFGEATCGGEYRAGRRALLSTLKKLRVRA